eukprot:CAMPEP_0198295928 /NCGR_PEP_ID=MMETSP1449-20131203/30200_1 /TAXON_ID=420275 /ORGANISM="Attheya septentrionalis, Strain CCMP2084" /LENGTH=289 /DNA_ID=CAMNT_0043996367 /DNA_START=287 /DNA_END=1156 /DNA_ORIENTATION=+
MQATEGDDGVGPQSQRIGFVGFGTIASAIARGLLSDKNQFCSSQSKVAVSYRSASKSGPLMEQYPDQVSIHTDNQEIVDQSDVIFLCVLPDQVDSILSDLKFDQERHTLVSLVSTSKLDNLIAMSGLSSDRVVKMICLPRVSECDNVSLLVPPGNNVVNTMCQSLGGYVECKDEEEMQVMMCGTALMGPLYGILNRNCEWLTKRGVSAKDAESFLGSVYQGMIQDAVSRHQTDANEDGTMFFKEMIDEQTPGGLNEQALKHIQDQGALDAYDSAMDAIHERLQGKGDDS